MVEATPLEFRHDVAGEVLEGAGRVGRRQHEAVAGPALEPLLHLVGDGLRSATEDRELPNRAATGEVDEVADGGILLPAEGDDAIPEAAPGQARQFLVGEFRIRVLRVEIEVERLGEQHNGIDGLGEGANVFAALLGGGLAVADDDVAGRAHAHAVRILPAAATALLSSLYCFRPASRFG